MKFQTKILLVTLVILILTLVLNSVLSLASFEKIYVTSLISIYEVSGKNLKRKIETSLRLGKPVDKFEGMDRLLSEVMAKNPEITDMGVGNVNGEILYHSNPHKIGTRFDPSLPVFNSPDQTHSLRIRKQYIIFLPLADRSNAIVGAITFTFPETVIYDRLWTMAYDNFTILWSIMLSFSVGLIVFIAMLVARPIRKDLIAIGGKLDWPPKISEDASGINKMRSSSADYMYRRPAVSAETMEMNSKYFNIAQIRNELDRLDFHLSEFLAQASEKLSCVQCLEREKQTLIATIQECTDIFEHLKQNFRISSEDAAADEIGQRDFLENSEKIMSMIAIAGCVLVGSGIKPLSETWENRQ